MTVAELINLLAQHNPDLPAEVRHVAPCCLNEMRDQLRLAALQLLDSTP